MRVLACAFIGLCASCLDPAETALRQARRLAQTDQKKEALQILKAACLEMPHHAELRAQAGELALALGQFDVALQAFEEASMLDRGVVRPEAVALARFVTRAELPSADDGPVLSSVSRLLQGGAAEAGATLRLLPTPTTPPSATVEFLRGSAMMLAGADATEHFRALATQLPTLPHGHYGLARLAARDADPRACLSALSEARRRWGQGFPAEAVRGDAAFAFLKNSSEFSALVTP